MTGVEVTHVDHTTEQWSWQNSQIDPSWCRIYIAQANSAISDVNIQELEGHVCFYRIKQKLVWHRGVLVRNEAISDWVNIGNISSKWGSLPVIQERTNKGFLNEYYSRVMLVNIDHEGTKPFNVPDTACIPGDNVKLRCIMVVLAMVCGS